MRELDVLLTRWLEERYESSSDTDKDAFRRLLTLSDPELIGYLLRGDRPEDPQLAGIIDRIRGEP